LLPFGLYRSPLPRNGAVLPYIFTNPPKETVLAGQDKIILFGNPQIAAAVFLQFEIALDRRDGKVSLGVQVSIDSFREKKPLPYDRKPSSRMNPMPSQDYQPIGRGESRNRAKPVSEYQPIGGGDKKRNARLNPPTDYQPIGAMEKKPSTRLPTSEYQPMGARQKPAPAFTEKKTPSTTPEAVTPFPPSQYIPRGAARVHPISQTQQTPTPEEN
jgi:hypothetical protein